MDFGLRKWTAFSVKKCAVYPRNVFLRILGKSSSFLAKSVQPVDFSFRTFLFFDEKRKALGFRATP